MSGQRARKTRIGSSRRRVSNQNEKSEADDEFHKTDNPSAVQDHMTEENTESGSKHLASSEVTGNRRKLGSSRRIKGRQHVKDSIAESCHEAREEVVEKATSNEALFNQSSKLLPGTTEMESASYQSQDFVEPDLSHIQFRHSENQGEETNPENKCNEDTSTENMKMLTEKNESFREESRELSENSIARRREVMLDEQTIQDEPGEMSTLASEEMKQEELSQGSEHDIMSHDSSMCSSTIPDDSFEFQNPTATNCPEAFLESLIPKSENVVEDGHERADDNKLEVADFCKSSEIMLEGMDIFHTFQSEEVSDHVKSNAHFVGMSEMSSFILDSVPPIDHQMTDQSNSREMPDELPSVHSVMDKENKERDEAMELLRQSGNLQANYLVSESRTKVEDTESPNKPVIITEESRPVEPTDLECINEQLPTEELPTDERQNFKLSHLDANPFTQLHQSEDAVNNKVHEQEVKPTQIKEMHPIQIHDAARNLESPFGNLTDVNVEIGDTYQSELIVKSVDDSANEQEVSNPDNKLDGHPTKQSNSEVLNQRHEDDYVYDSGEPRINTIERADTAPGPVYVDKGQVGGDMKAIAEDIVHQEGERLPCETEDNESSLQTLHSDSGLCAGERTDISNSTGRRRKMASTRRTFRDKLKQHKDNDNHEDVNMEKIEMPIDFKAECSSQSNETSCTNMEPLPERVTPALIKSTSYEKTSHNIDSPLVETHQLDNMTDLNLSISGWQPYSSSEEAQSQSRERDDPLDSPPQDNSVSLREQTNTENMEEDTLLSQIQTNSKTMTTEICSSSETHGLVKSTEKVSEKEEEKKLIEELESGSEFTGYEEFKIMESRTSTLDELNQEETFQDQTMEVIYCDKEATRQEFHMKETNEVIETVEDFTKKDVIEIGEKCDTEAEGSMGVQVVSEEDEVGEQFGDPAKEDHTAQEINTSREISYSELLPAAQNKNVLSDTLAAFDICHEEDLRKEFPEPVVHVSEQSDADATDVHQSQQGILDRPSQNKDLDEIPQIKSTGKRRKMGSTRRMQHGRKQEGGTDNKDETKEGNLNTEVDMRNQELFEAELKTIVEAKCNTSDLHVVLEEREIDKGASYMTHADISTQSINQEENIVNMGIQMGSNRQSHTPNHHNEPKETVHENTANEDVGGFFLTTCKSAVIQITDNEEMIDNEPKTTEGKTIDSTPRSLHVGKDNEVTEEALKETKEMAVKLSVMETEEVSQTENTETSLNTMYKPDDVIKEEQEHQETIENITGEIQDQDIKKDKVSKPEETSNVNEVDFEIVKSEDSGGTGEGDDNAQTTIQEPNNMSEEAHNIKIEIKNASEDSNPANRRRKMGSTRRNLRPKGEELHRKQEADNEMSEIAKNVGDAIMAESESSIKTLQLQMEHKDGDSEKEKEKIFETTKECSHQSVFGIEENPETEIGEKYDTEAEGSMGVQVVSEKDEVGEQFGHPAKEDHTAQEINTSREISCSELLPAAQNKNVLSDTLAAFDICHEEYLRKEFPEPVVHVSEQSDADATDVHQSQQGILDRPSQNKDLDEIPQIKSTGKRRKMGSTRRMQHGRKQEGGTDNKDETKEGNLNTEVDMRNQESFEAELKTIVEAKCNTSDLHVVLEEREIDKGASDMTRADISTQSINQKEDINMGIQMGSNRQLDPFENTANEDVGGFFLTACKSAVIQITDNKEMIDNEPKTTEGRTTDSIPRSLHGEKGDEVTEEALKETKEMVVKLLVMETEEVSQTENTETSLNTMYKPDDVIKEEQEHQETIENITGEIQDQDIKKDEVDFEIVKSEDSGGTGEGDENAQTTIQEPNMSEEAHNIKIEIKNESEVSNPANRRKKMGSTRRNLRPKGEELHRKQEADNEMSEIAKNVGDAIMAESESSIKTLQLQMEHKDGDSEKEREKIFETMKECSHQSVLGIEENPETERHLTPSCLPSKSATFPEHDLLSESKSGGRRRKMGSNRKSRGHQHHEDPTECEDKITDAGDGRDLKSKTEESAIGTFEEVVTSYDKSGQKPSSSSSISSTGDPSRPVGVLSQRASEQETPNQLPGPEDHLVQAREKTHSLGFSKEGDLRPNCYNVVMVGNSNVGKTSFMKRVQSGMFSLDFCASVGIDTCMQSVRVDGKTVVLQLWDTAGQERFHSITRQVFHKAQAILLMYDVTSFQSFSDVRYWVSCIQEGAVENVIIILLGNKSDCAERQVQSHQGEVLAKDYNIDFMECSAATGENVMQSLETVARMLCQKSDTKEEGMVLRKEPQQRKKSGCC